MRPPRWRWRSSPPRCDRYISHDRRPTMSMTALREGERSRVAGWGGMSVPRVEIQSEDLARLTIDVPLTRGLGRSYGDSSLPPASRPVVAATPLADRLLSFDEHTGCLRAEAGYSLRDLHRTFLPRGWVTAVSPGT